MRPGSARGGRGRVRIIGGALRGSRLAVQPLPGLRPTPDRVRETLFNWLMPVVAGARCLDLYAGTGALGFEAASRGAREVVLIEAHRAQAAALEADRQRLGIAAVTVHCMRAEAFLQGPPRAFDLVFVDPPYALDAWSACLAALVERAWLAAGAFVYVEAPLRAVYAVPSPLQLHREGRAGEVGYRLYTVGRAVR